MAKPQSANRMHPTARFAAGRRHERAGDRLRDRAQTRRKEVRMSLLAKSKGEVTYKELSTLHKWALVVLISIANGR